MQAVVPAAGRGTRLRPLTEEKPKALVEIDGRPILSHCFGSLLDAGIEELIVVVGYRKEALIDHYGDSYEGVPITYAHQPEPIGLADAVSRAEPHVEDSFVVLNGDNVLHADLQSPIDRFRADDPAALLVTERASTEEARTTGVVETDANGDVVELLEKPDEPPTNLVTTGFYAFAPAIFRACRRIEPSDRGEYELADAINRLIERGTRVESVRLCGERVNVNTPVDVERAERLVG